MTFQQHIPFDPAGDWAALLAQLPARWAVYLLADADGRPFQLLSVKNLRASIANRLCEHPTDERTRSIPYRQMVRGISFTRVDSVAEAEWVYLQHARELFPDTARKLLANWEPWFVQIDPQAPFPRWTVTADVDFSLTATTFGPISTKEKAGRWIETLEDAFDLCRYHSILVQAPRGTACAYKQMHKCPAPCDGSISMAMYRHQLDLSIAAAADPGTFAIHEERMRQAAGSLQFELAGKIRQYARQLASLHAGHYAELRPVGGMDYLAVLRGAGVRSWKLMRVSARGTQLLGEFRNDAEALALLRSPDTRPPEPSRDPLSFLARQIMLASPDRIFTDGSPSAIMAAAKSLARRKAPEEPADEGLDQAT